MLNRDQQKLLENISTGRDLTTGDINQKSNTFINLILSSKESIYSDKEALISTLSSILAQINPETIQKAYENSLPPDAELWYSKPDNIESILSKLDEFRRLVEFFAELNQDDDISEELRDKLKHYAEKLLSKKSQEDKIDKPPNNCPQQLESFVLFTLNPTENKDKFLLNAWLIKDNSVEGIAKYKSLLSDNETQSGIVCKLSEIQSKIDIFIEGALNALSGKQYNLILEFFLPSHLMLTEVDHWQIKDWDNQLLTLGTRYPVRMRSLERQAKRYLNYRGNQWFNHWNKVNTVLNEESVFVNFEHLPAMDKFNGKSLEFNLRDKIGLKVTCPPSISKLQELFRAIMTAATPIAIWTRRDLNDCGCVSAIDDFLSDKLLCNLCESVREIREEADANPKEHFGSHLSILWEDPSRLIPDVMVELTPPEM